MARDLQDKNVSLVCLNQALEEADIVVILVKHREFVGMQSGKLIDFVNI